MPENTANNAASYTTPWDTITLLDRYLQQMSVSVVACPRNQLEPKTINEFKQLAHGFCFPKIIITYRNLVL